ncbi:MULTISPECIES: hypothetical protein [unclassified Saccharopolyspora]|uniref:hypothetical protein n=1 Tax=Saccharopolyspora TaxID=1835 RepID=UPI00190CDD7B|nr:hypothetical protein [Saccharopolyspora sp. HNM0986]MBK0868647.1 hypothetical protein [Saccharopolyspora sp. HNM0986]
MRFLVWSEGGRARSRWMLRRRSARRLDALGLPHRFTAAQLLDRARAHLGREIYFAAVELPPRAPSGLALLPAGCVIIVADARTSRWHRWHIWLHELMHLLWGHVGRPVGDPAPALRSLFGDLPPEVLDRVLTRSACSAQEEAAAEMMASVAMQRISSWDSPQAHEVPDEAREVLRRFQMALG